MTFEFRPALTISAAIAVVILISLGVWQLERRVWKLDLIARAEARVKETPIPFEEAVRRQEAGENMEYAPVTLTGVYANDLEAPVFGTLDGEPGAYIFTPMKTSAPGEAGRFVYIDRGFAPQQFIAPQTRPESEIAGQTSVTGLFRTAERPTSLEQLVTPAADPGGKLWFRRNPALFAARAHIDASRYYIDSSGAENPSKWPKGGVTRLEFYNHHLEYALTWFGLAGALIGVYVALSLKRR
ncbi:MAG: SURF1 family protein [Alphaproteobacteria bacterium]|nr:SURF1 family protein [Alphaproteobacteria bacterium]